MARTILITGASGFIGSHLVEEGLRRGYEVYASIRKTSSKQYLDDPRIRFMELDFSHPETLTGQLKKYNEEGFRFDYIVHSAGITRALNKQEFFRVNDQFTRNFVEGLCAAGLIPGKFIFMSSLAAIGPGDPVTMDPLSDQSVPSPIDSYGKSKLAAERYLQALAGFPSLIVRPTGVYGPREKDYLNVYRNLNRGFEFYAGSKTQRTSFLYIDDLISIIYTLLDSKFLNKTWVVSDGSNYSAVEFCALVKKILNKKAIPLIVPLSFIRLLAEIQELMFKPFGTLPVLTRDKAAIIGSQNWQCDPSGIFKDITFSPRYSLEEGLYETIAWNRQHGIL